MEALKESGLGGRLPEDGFERNISKYLPGATATAKPQQQAKAATKRNKRRRKKRKPGRSYCAVCDKLLRAGLEQVGTCRCGGVYCGAHIHNHQCTFDYKAPPTRAQLPEIADVLRLRGGRLLRPRALRRRKTRRRRHRRR